MNTSDKSLIGSTVVRPDLPKVTYVVLEFRMGRARLRNTLTDRVFWAQPAFVSQLEILT
jgi:hypothetical protein